MENSNADRVMARAERDRMKPQAEEVSEGTPGQVREASESLERGTSLGKDHPGTPQRRLRGGPDSP